MVDHRARLEEERRTTLRRLSALTDDFNALVEAGEGSNADDEHDPEGSTLAFERAQVDAFVKQGRRDIEEIDAALERIGRGTYGTCELCGRPVVKGRLEVRPTARTCVGCA